MVRPSLMRLHLTDYRISLFHFGYPERSLPIGYVLHCPYTSLLASSMRLHSTDYLQHSDAMFPAMFREHSQLWTDSDTMLRAAACPVPVVPESVRQYGDRHVGYPISAGCDRVADMG